MAGSLKLAVLLIYRQSLFAMPLSSSSSKLTLILGGLCGLRGLVGT